MALDPSIILQGRAPDIVGQYSRGLSAGQQQNQIGRENALAGLYKTQGAGILAGDQGALNALAGIDLPTAMGVQTSQLGMQSTRLGMDAQRQGMAATQQRMDMLTREEKLALADRAAAMGAAERAAAAAEIENAVKMGMTAQSPEQWDALMSQMGAADLVGQFGQRQGLAARYMEIADVFKMVNPEPVDPTKNAPNGYRWITPGDPQSGVELLPGYTPKTGPDVVVNNGAEGDNFYKELDKGQATMFQGLMDQGIQAGRNSVLVDRMGAMLEQTPTGFEAAVKSALGQYGIATDGLDQVQSLNAMINQLIPAQRTPGSGPMSDKDLEMFKSSLPSLINQPGGNARILSTMRAIADYTLQQSEIASSVADRSITPAEGRKALAALSNPLGNVTGTGKAAPGLFEQMNFDQLNQVDVMTLDPAALDAFEARYNALKGGR